MFTPQVDLYDIESTNRDSISPVTGTRFNVPSQYIPAGGNLVAPESYGQVTGILPTAQSRGIATLPGGVPLYKKQPNGKFAVVGGIGVFFPGTTGYATEENSKLNTPLLHDKHKPISRRSAEYMAFVAAGGSSQAGVPFNGSINGAPALPNFTEPFGRIDLAGITLNIFGGGGLEGIKNLLNFGATLGAGTPNDGTDYPVDAAGDTYLAGQGVPYGWLVTPHSSSLPGGPSVADIEAIVARGIAEADQVRAQIRLPFNSTAKMVFAVSDENGNILGLYRMPDATYFSIGVAVAKARNVAYYDNPSQLQPIDKIKGVPAGTAFTSRTFRYVSLPFFPEGIDIDPAWPRLDPDRRRRDQVRHEQGCPTARQRFSEHPGLHRLQSQYELPRSVQHGQPERRGALPRQRAFVQGHDRQRDRSTLIGGLGVSGDGVFQDDDVTSVASIAYAPPRTVDRADQVKVRGVRLPFFKYNRNPHVPLNGPKYPVDSSQDLPLPPPRKKTRPISRREPMRPSCIASRPRGPGSGLGGRRCLPAPRTRRLDAPALWHRLHKKRERRRPASRDRFRTPTSAPATRARWPGTSEPSTTAGRHRLLRRRRRADRARSATARVAGRDEGTWGWDETGSSHFRRRVILGWSQGRKYQGGTGAYRTDGHVPPDVIYAATSTVNSLGRRREGQGEE